DFRNSIIVMTSNIGAELIRKGGTIGFASRTNEVKVQQMDYEKMKEKLLGEVKKNFRPEFLNRIDSVVVFHALTKEHIRKIVELMLETVSKQLAEKEIKLEVTDAAKDFLGEKGYDEVFGARPLRRVIQNMVEDKLSDSLLRGKFRPGDTAIVDLEGEEITVHPAEAVGALLGDDK
ncbi:AAA family ATPase, partial [Chloroflexota bacterium]